MALPSSPPISLAQVCAEFSAPSSTPLASFLRGGSWVPNTPANLGVPTSLPISLTDLCGASAYTTPPLSASLYPTSVSGSGTVSTSISTGITTASYSGGSGSVSYAWERVSGDTTLQPSSASAATVSFSSTTPLGSPGSRSGVWRCKVTRGSETAYTGNVSITLTWTAAALSASLYPTSVSGSGTVSTSVSTGTTTASYSGGSGSVSYAWERVSGDTTLQPSSASAATVSFSSTTPLGSPGSRSGVWRCKVTRGSETAYTNNVSITLTWTAAALSASAAPTSVYGLTTTNGGNAISNDTTASYSGGSGSVSYAWERVSGDTLISIRSPSSATTDFSAIVGTGKGQASSRSGVFRCKVTRGSETAYTNNVSVLLEYSP